MPLCFHVRSLAGSCEWSVMIVKGCGRRWSQPRDHDLAHDRWEMDFISLYNCIKDSIYRQN